MRAELEDAVGSAIAASFLGGISGAALGHILTGSTLREIPAGRTFLSTEQPHRCGIVVSGLVRLYAVRPSGAQITMARVGAGAAIGVRAIPRRRNPVNAQAINDCEFLQFDPAHLVAAATGNMDLAWGLACELDRRLDDTQLHIESSYGGTVRQKVAGILLDLSVEGEPLVVDASQELIAELTGTSREAVGRELRRLEGEGLVELSRRRVSVRDAMRLQAVATDSLGQRTLRPTSQTTET